MAGKQGRPTSLTEDLIPLAAYTAERCPNPAAIARSIGVHPETVREWIKKGRDPNAPELFQRFSAEILAAINRAEIALSSKLINGDPKDAAWVLTHSHFFRDQWSDAAAERKAVKRSQERTVAAIEASSLSNEQKHELLLRLAATGEHPNPESLTE